MSLESDLSESSSDDQKFRKLQLAIKNKDKLNTNKLITISY